MSLKSAIRRIPLVLPVWRSINRIPAIARLRESIQLKRMYGQFAPEALDLGNSGATMFVDPHEKRGRAVLRCRAAGQPALKAIWGRMVRELSPTLVLDMGLNYGEFVLNERYAVSSTILGIEANPALIPWLERSRGTHPNGSQMRFIHALADAETAASGKFYINPKWSGSSSALNSSERSGFKSCDVPVIAIDDLVAERALEQDRLAFKIDVEGFEPRVLDGMTTLLRRCPSWIGLIEFNGTYLERLGVTAESILSNLLTQAKIYAIDHDGTSKAITSPDWQTFFPGQSIDELSVDLLLISHGSTVPAEALLDSKNKAQRLHPRES